MTKVTFEQFINDFNELNQTNYRVIQLDTNSVCDTIYELYETDDFEIDYDEEIIELY